jgi:TonB family protein
MGRLRDDQPASRVVEEPKRSVLPYFAAAIVAAVTFWALQQHSIQDTAPNPSRPPAQSSGPSKGDLRTLFSADDYPIEAQRNGEEGTVRAELAIDRQGRVSGCTIVNGSGHVSLDNATCRILQSRARFTPARDASGRPVPDTDLTPPVVWRLEG